ncbi:MAG: nucleotide-binding protein [Balneolaceae bacterium]
MDKSLLKKRLTKLLEQGNEFSYRSLPKGEYGYPNRLPPEWIAWEQRVNNIVSSSFAPDSAPATLIRKASKSTIHILGNGQDKFEEAQSILLRGIEEALQIIKNDFFGELINVPKNLPKSIDTKKIFIVHGHDHVAKTELEIFLRELNLKPVVLHREADEGQTIIEKFEKHSNVGYAFIILSKDDKAQINQSKNGRSEDFEFRARQNVILELGFFVGKLGRNRVCCLMQNGISVPSDISGLVYKPFHEHIEEVKYALIKELNKAGYPVEVKL